MDRTTLRDIIGLSVFGIFLVSVLVLFVWNLISLKNKQRNKNNSMCSVHPCTNEATKKVTLVVNTSLGERTKTVEICNEHWEALNRGTREGLSMGCTITK